MLCVNNFKQTGLALTMYDTDHANIPVGSTPGSTQASGGGLWGWITEANQTNSQDFQWCSTSVFGLLYDYSGTMKIGVCSMLDPANSWPMNVQGGTMCTGRPENTLCYEPGSCRAGTCDGRYYAYALRGGKSGGNTPHTFTVLNSTKLEQYPDIVKGVTFASGVNMYSGDGIENLSGANQSTAGQSVIWGSTILSDAQFSAHTIGQLQGLTLLSFDGAAKLHNISPGYLAAYTFGLGGMSRTDLMYRRFEN
jgi:hypothetical protein